MCYISFILTFLTYYLFRVQLFKDLLTSSVAAVTPSAILTPSIIID